MNYLSVTPFLTDRRKFAIAVGTWMYNTGCLVEKKNILKNIVSPDKNNQFLNILGNANIRSKDNLYKARFSAKLGNQATYQNSSEL